MIDAVFAVPGDITRPTGGYAYARKVLDLLPNYGVNVQLLQLPSSFPYPDSQDIDATRRAFAQLRPDTPVLVDGLAYGAMPPLLVKQITQPIVAMVHHPLAYETGITPADKRKLIAFEMHALEQAEKVIATSKTTAELLQYEYGVPDSKLTVAEPGTMPAERAQGCGKTLQLLSVGAVIKRKGYTFLIDALSHIRHRDWQLTIAGATAHDPIYTNEVRKAILQSGLRSQIELTGAISDDALHALFSKADLFVMPSLFEGYGMVLTEAVARGLPIVCTTGGAMAETVPNEVAIKVPPGNSAALAKALDLLLNDSDQRKSLSDKAWAYGHKLPSWENCIGSISDVLKALTVQPDIKVPS